MARVCQVTGPRPGFDRDVSHSHRRTRRRFDVDIRRKRSRVPTLRRRVALTLGARGVETVDLREER